MPSGCETIDASRSEEHTSELQSRQDISYAVFCLKKKIFFNDTATTEIYTEENTLSLHDALPISGIMRYSLALQEWRVAFRMRNDRRIVGRQYEFAKAPHSRLFDRCSAHRMIACASVKQFLKRCASSGRRCGSNVQQSVALWARRMWRAIAQRFTT